MTKSKTLFIFPADWLGLDSRALKASDSQITLLVGDWAGILLGYHRRRHQRLSTHDLQLSAEAVFTL